MLVMLSLLSVGACECEIVPISKKGDFGWMDGWMMGGRAITRMEKKEVVGAGAW